MSLPFTRSEVLLPPPLQHIQTGSGTLTSLTTSTFRGLDTLPTIKAAEYTVVKFKLFLVFRADGVRCLIQPAAEIQPPFFQLFHCVNI